DVDAGVDDGDLDAPAGVGGTADLSRRPRRLCGYQVEVRVVVVSGPVQPLVLRRLHARRPRDRGERRPVELDGNGVEGNVVVAGDVGVRGVVVQPGLEGVALRGEQGTLALDRRTREVDLLA